MGAAPACRYLQVGQAGRDGMHAEAFLRVPGEHLADHARFGLLDAQACRIAGVLWVTPIAIGGINPWEQLPSP